MEEKKEDRRIRRSKKMLRQALVDIMIEKDIKDISVRDIAERADLNRGTFYLHYSTPHDLLDDLENELVEELAEIISAFHPVQKVHCHFILMDQLIHFVCAHEQIFNCLFLNGFDDVFIQKIVAVIMEKGFQLLRELCVDIPEEQMLFTFQFVAYGIVGMLKKWFEDGRKVPTEQIVLLTDQMVTPLFDSMLGVQGHTHEC